MAQAQAAKVERLDTRQSRVRPRGAGRAQPPADPGKDIHHFAYDPRIALDKLDALIAADERRDLRAAQRAYSAAMTAMTAELPVITERGEITFGDRVVATYALWEDINETIKSVLAKHGFALSFRTGCEEHAIAVTAVLDHKDGHQEATSLRLPPDVGPERNAVQAVGSTVSYGNATPLARSSTSPPKAKTTTAAKREAL